MSWDRNKVSSTDTESMWVGCDRCNREPRDTEDFCTWLFSSSKKGMENQQHICRECQRPGEWNSAIELGSPEWWSS
jgi:hypothetical protein